MNAEEARAGLQMVVNYLNENDPNLVVEDYDPWETQAQIALREHPSLAFEVLDSEQSDSTLIVLSEAMREACGYHSTEYRQWIETLKSSESRRHQKFGKSEGRLANFFRGLEKLSERLDAKVSFGRKFP